MFFFNDECDLIDDDQYDLFTLATEIERRRASTHRCSRARKQQDPSEGARKRKSGRLVRTEQRSSA